MRGWLSGGNVEASNRSTHNMVFLSLLYFCCGLKMLITLFLFVFVSVYSIHPIIRRLAFLVLKEVRTLSSLMDLTDKVKLVEALCLSNNYSFR